MHRALLRLVVLYVLVGILYAAVTPLFEKPDEDGHYGYVLYLREHRKLPPLSFSGGFPSEYKQPPLYYAITSILTSWLPSDADPARLLVTNPYMDLSVPGYRNDNRNVFLHPPHMTPLALGARLISLAFGLGTMVSSYFLASQVFHKDSLAAITAAAVVAFQPQFLYISTAVNNDAAIAFFGTLALTILIYRMRKGDFPHFAMLVGGVLGLASITKVSGLVFFPLTGLGLLFIHSGFRRSFFRDGLVIIVVALFVGGWWYVRNGLVYRDPLSIGIHTSADTAPRVFSARIGHDLSSIEHTFWANPSRTFVSRMWLDKIPVWWGRTSLALLGLSLLLRSCFKRPRHPSRTTYQAYLLLLVWPLTFLLLLVTYWTQRAWWAYGRLLFPTIAPIGIVLISGWLHTFPQSWRRIVAPFGAGTLMIASILIPSVSIYPMYHPWRKPTEEQIEHPADTVYVDAAAGNEIAQLIGYNLPEAYAFPGSYLPVEVCWKALAQTETPYPVFLQLLDLSQLESHGSPGVWGGRRTYPGLGNLPTDRWTPGQSFCDTILIQVSPAAPTPLGAAIEVGFIDPETDNRLKTTSPEGDALKLVSLRGVPILSHEQLPVSEIPASYILDNSIGLVQMQLGRPTQDTLKVTLTWQSLQTVPYDATTFVHLGDATGRGMTQVDRQPLHGRFPTSYWLPGQVITDTISLILEESTYAEPLVLTLGMYTWPSLERLSVVDGRGTAQRDNVITVAITSMPLVEEVSTQ